jgi:vacuolar-type H+-ATPase subunit I/STV1
VDEEEFSQIEKINEKIDDKTDEIELVEQIYEEPAEVIQRHLEEIHNNTSSSMKIAMDPKMELSKKIHEEFLNRKAVQQRSKYMEIAPQTESEGFYDIPKFY